jgi:hypothetical protein
VLGLVSLDTYSRGLKEIEANLKACQKKVVKKKNNGGDLRRNVWQVKDTNCEAVKKKCGGWFRQNFRVGQNISRSPRD